MADDVAAWLESQGLGRYAEAFAANDIDLSLLPDLTDADLQALGVTSLGHRKKLLAAIAGLKTAEPLTRPVPRTPSGIWQELEARGFTLEQPLGSGGMGEVYVARQAGVDRRVAIKVLRVSDEPEAAVRFAREARAIAALQHPHTVRLFDFVIAGDGGSAIVMELVEGESMWDLLQRERRLRLARVAPLLMQVCDALGEAHTKGIIHRDLKPGNILLQSVEGYQDFARVLDFGLVRWMRDDERRLTRTGAVFGTPSYLSPEQIQGGEIGPASDLYAIGVILHEALAGELPFAGEGEGMMFRHVTEAAPQLPADVERPAAIDRLLERVLAKSPSLRPPSARALRDELASAMSGPIEVRTPASAMPAPSTERRRIVVVDVRRDDDADDDGAHDRLRAFHATVERTRRRHGGYLAARDASHVQLVFGAPVARRDDPRRAMRAARELQAALGSVRIGVADGLGVAGSVGDAGDRGYLVTGPPMLRAAQLAIGAAPGEIAAADGLADRARDEDSLQAMPFVGREQELADLVEIVEATMKPASRPAGRIVVIAGEAGIGKSRLVERLLSRARQLGARCASGAVVDVEVGRDETALHQLVGALLDLPPPGPDRLAAVEQGGRGLRAEQWPFLYHFLGVPLPGPMQRLYDAMEPAARLAGYRDMLATLLAAERREQPLVLAVEDVHWADPPTLDGVATLCGIIRGQPSVLILTTRVEGEEQWRHVLAGHPVHRIELEPLRAEEAGELAERLGASDDVRAAVVERAAGHPLLLTELARGGDPGAMPHSIDGLIHGRVDRLPDRDRAAIQVAAVLGPRFTLAHLRELLGDRSYLPTLLVDYRLLAADGDTGLRFPHALVREAVYDALVGDRRRGLHERAATLLADDLAVAAHHLERAGSPNAGAMYLRAAQRELASDHDVRARHLAARGLAVANEPADRIALLALRGDVELELGDAAASLAAYEEMAALATDPRDAYRAGVGQAAALRVASRYADALAALGRAEAHSGGVPSAKLHYLRGAVHFALGELDDCLAAHEQSLALAREAGDDEAIARALSGLGDAHYGAGRMASAARVWQECIALCRDAFLLGVEVTNLPMLAMAKVFAGEPNEAANLASEAVLRATRLSRRRAEALARGAVSFAALELGDFATALRAADQAREISKQLGTVVFEQAGHYYAAQAHLGLGDRDAARAQLDLGLALARKHGMHFLGAALLGTLARLLDGDDRRAALDEGEALARGGLAFSRVWFYENAVRASDEARYQDGLRLTRALAQG